MTKAKRNKLNGIGKAPRASAIELLVRANNGGYANDIVPQYLSRSNFEPRDRALITNIVYSTLKSQIRIDFALAKISKRPINTLDEIVLNALRSVVAQIVSGFEHHGVVNETVKAMPFAYKGFVNAICRKVIDRHKKNALFEDEPFDIENSLPAWILHEITNTFPQRVDEVVRAINSDARVTLVPIGDGITIDGDQGALIKNSRLVSSQGNIGEISAVKNGQALIVDQGSQLVAQCVDVSRESVVLDVCAAPGGKSFLLSSRAQKVIASDISLNRIEKIKDTKRRINAENVSAVAADASKLPFVQGSFSHILVDAPCSGLGVLRRRPDARNNITSDIVDELVDLQKVIITEAVTRLNSGDKLIYSVCTFTERETLGIDNWLASQFPELVSENLSGVNDHLIQHGRGYLLAPTPDSDAMYVIRLIKS